MNEIWVPARGWEESYEVSSEGRVRSVPRTGETIFGKRSYGGGFVKPILRKGNGYLVVNLTTSGRRRQVLLHRLILRSFSCEIPAGMDVCHNNGNRADPRLCNLRWDTRKGNHADKKLHGTSQVGERNGNSRLTDDGVKAIRQSDSTGVELAKDLGVSASTIYRVRNGQAWNHV